MFSFSKNRDGKCREDHRAKREQEMKKLEDRILEAEKKQLAAEDALSAERQRYVDEKKAAEESEATRQAERKERHQRRKEERKKRKEERKAAKAKAKEEATGEEENSKWANLKSTAKAAPERRAVAADADKDIIYLKDEQADTDKVESANTAEQSASAAAAQAAVAAATEDSTTASGAADSNGNGAANRSASSSSKASGEEEGEVAIPAKVVIVGGGPTSYATMHQILTLDPRTEIIYVTEEDSLPYDPSHLSKELLWQRDTEASGELKWRDDNGDLVDPYYASAVFTHPKSNVTLLKGRRAIDLDAGRHIITLDDGTQYKYEKCLLAPGLKPNQFDVALPENSAENVTQLRSPTDFKKLHNATLNPDVKHITVIGNDFTAAEIVDGLVDRAKVAGANYKVSQIFPEEGVLASIFPLPLASYFTKVTSETLGVDMNPGTRIQSITDASDSGYKFRIALDNDKNIDTDHIVLSIGGKPNVDLAKRAILEIDEFNGGIVVNQEMSARSDLYIGGDAASYFDGHLGRRRVEGIDHAETSGRYIGMNMMGKNYAYVYQPVRWGSISKYIAYKNIGLVDSRLDMVAVWQKGPNPELSLPEADIDSSKMPLLTHNSSAPLSTEYEDAQRYERGVIYYMNGTKVVGVSMINVDGQTDVATRLVTFPREFEDITALTRQIYLGNKPKVEIEEDQL